MRFFFFLIGFVFDIVVLAASAGALAVATNPDWLDRGLDYVRPLLDTTAGRAEIAAGAIVFMILSFRLLFLLMFGRSDREFVIRTGDNGEVSISHSSLNRVLARLVEEKSPGGELRRSEVVRRNDAFDLRVRVRLDLVNVNLTDYSSTLEERIRTHFADTLGIKLGGVRIQAECAAARRES